MGTNHSTTNDSWEEKINNNWKNSKENNTITQRINAPIGMNESGIVELDLHENADGPHMLVAGTTGSGKTESIITYLLGLCMNFSPEDVNLLLVDMKGGGFTKRIGNLPHVVGQITDIEGDENGTGAEYMLRRFLFAMTAEIKKRKKQFNRLHVDNIDDYIVRYRELEAWTNDGKEIKDYVAEHNLGEEFPFENIADEPRLAHLILVVDEFSELKRFSTQSNDVDFISEITTIARVGRSLGFHIILVSQNIEGAITDDIRVNTNARLCHKVATPQASKEMIGSTLAASPTMPRTGRAFLLSGNGKRHDYFQAGYTKAISDMIDSIRIELVNKTGMHTVFYDSDMDKKEREPSSELKTQLQTIKDSIISANRELTIQRPNQIFSPPLQHDLSAKKLDDLMKERNKSNTEEQKILLGQYDNPDIQDQPPFYYDYRAKNLIVFGEAGSGKTSLIRNLLVQIHNVDIPHKQERIYIVDFGGHLGECRNLQLVYGCYNSSNEENVKRVFRRVREEMAKNTVKLEGKSFLESPTCDHITLVIDNVNALLEDERYSTYRDEILYFCREGLAKGLTVVVTAKETSGLARFMANFGVRVAFSMSPESYAEIFNTPHIAIPVRHPGRGLVTFGTQIHELQTSYASQDDFEECKLKEEGDINKEAERIDSMGRMLERGKKDYDYSYSASSGETKKAIVGFDYNDQNEVIVDFDKTKCIAIYGKRNFGKTNLLQLLLFRILEKYGTNCRFYLFDDGRKQLSRENLTLIWRNAKAQCFADQDVNKELERVNRGEEDANITRVFVFQSRITYNDSAINKNNQSICDYIQSSVERILSCNKDIVIFSDARRIVNPYKMARMNSLFQTVFLLDDIGSFVAERGRNSVFADMDIKELKAEYAKCICGDGFYYDVESDNLKKVRFLKCVDERRDS